MQENRMHLTPRLRTIMQQVPEGAPQEQTLAVGGHRDRSRTDSDGTAAPRCDSKRHCVGFARGAAGQRCAHGKTI